ncbi:MAG: carboxylate-amine ligase [Gammaproteobacteria bacterium]|nr:carboxylate-amine ligase [Gammaproteobacteria bacterium]
MNTPPFTIGIEEEYLLVDKATRDLATDPPEQMRNECQEACPGQITPEFLRAQIEIGTRVCKNIGEAREELTNLRGCVVDIADQYGLAPIAASTHPFAHWQAQKQTDNPRYDDLNRDMQASARRLLICGMHVHVGLDDDELRVDLMNQFTYFLPHLLALSCSSPFWEGDDTGLQSYRLTVFDGMPRTRLPETFSSYSEYQRHIDILISSGIIQDATKIWWDVRPSARYPTLEMRVTDVCTRVDDALCVAALTVSIMSMLYRLRCENKRWRQYAHMLIQENRWRALRYGVENGLVDFGCGKVISFTDLFAEILELVSEDARRLGCLKEVMHAVKIIQMGNSARLQRQVYYAALDNGKSKEDALRDVVDFLVAETRRKPSSE